MSKIKEEKYREILNSHKKLLFNKNYGHKIDVFSKSNQLTNNKSKNQPIIQHNNSLETYIEELKEKYKENPIFFENMNSSNNKYFYRFSFCFFCHNLVVAYQDKVICINGCFTLDVNTDDFNNNYTLDMFLEEYSNFTSNHLFCNKEDIIPIYVDNEKRSTFFICSKCDKKIFDKADIVL